MRDICEHGNPPVLCARCAYDALAIANASATSLHREVDALRSEVQALREAIARHREGVLSVVTLASRHDVELWRVLDTHPKGDSPTTEGEND